MKYVLRPAARADLADIWSYTAERWNIQQADDYVAAITSRIEDAVGFPQLGSPIPTLASLYRKLAAGHHRIIYRHTEDELTIVRILHERQDALDILHSDEPQ